MIDSSFEILQKIDSSKKSFRKLKPIEISITNRNGIKVNFISDLNQIRYIFFERRITFDSHRSLQAISDLLIRTYYNSPLYTYIFIQIYICTHTEIPPNAGTV